MSEGEERKAGNDLCVLREEDEFLPVVTEE